MQERQREQNGILEQQRSHALGLLHASSTSTSTSSGVAAMKAAEASVPATQPHGQPAAGGKALAGTVSVELPSLAEMPPPYTEQPPGPKMDAKLFDVSKSSMRLAGELFQPQPALRDDSFWPIEPDATVPGEYPR